MAHRGRLNVLANVLQKPPSEIFAEFQDKVDPTDPSSGGDVKYHLGYSIDRTFGERRPTAHKVHLSLAFNPSHLEWVNTVVQGRVRAKQDRVGDTSRTRCLPLLIHGDAAFAGQGIVAEALNMSELDGYRVGGTVHVVVNNQIGFTTSPQRREVDHLRDRRRAHAADPDLPRQRRGSRGGLRRSSIWRSTSASASTATSIIELWCYRKLGHNEGDEPSFTQPVMYRAIAAKPSIRMAYLAYDAANPAPGGDASITVEETDAIAAAQARRRWRRSWRSRPSAQTPPRPSTFAGAWARIKGGADSAVPEVPTAVAPSEIQRGDARASPCCPPDFTVHPKLKAVVIDGRAAMGAGEKPIDWGMGEALAFGTLLAQGARVRLSGQDSRRGTFSHRHAVLLRLQRRRTSTRRSRTSRDKQGTFEVRDSPLSEAGVLGFDYGYSLDMPEGLMIWEAQFGDFVNAAQVIIDQFIVVVGGQVAPGERPGVAAAARHGGAGARALERAARALPEPVRERQHAGLQPDHAGAVLPRAAAAGAAAVPQAADHHVAQEPAAVAGGDVAAGRFHERRLPRTSSRTPMRKARPSQRDPKRSSASCSAPARSITIWSPPVRNAATMTSPSCASSSCTRLRKDDLLEVLSVYPGGHAGRLGAGRAEEHGRLGVHEPRAAGAARRVRSTGRASAGRCRPARRRVRPSATRASRRG